MDWASQEHLGVSVFLSLGNRADIDEADGIEYFNHDPHTRVIALYLEGVKRPVYFQNALAGAAKPREHSRPAALHRGVWRQNHTPNHWSAVTRSMTPSSGNTEFTGPIPLKNSMILPRPWPTTPSPQADAC